MAAFINSITIATANTNRDGSGAAMFALVKPTPGTEIELSSISIRAFTTTTAGMIRLFIKVGGVMSLLHEVPVAAITVGASTAGFAHVIAFITGLDPMGLAVTGDTRLPPLVIPPNAELYVATHNSESFAIHAVGQSRPARG